MKITLKNRILIPILGIIFVTCTVLSLTSYILGRNALDASIQQQMKQVNSAAILQVDDWFGEKRLELEHWASSKEYRNALRSNGTDTNLIAEIAAELEDIKKRYRAFQDLHLTDAKGIVAASSNPKAMGTLDIHDRNYFINAMKGETVISEVMASRTTQKPFVAMAAPIKDQNRIIGILFGSLDLEYFCGKFIDNSHILKSGFTCICDEQGVFIAHPDKTKILKAKLSDFEWGKTIMSTKNGVIRYTSDGMEKMTIYDTSKLLGWFVSVSVPISELNAPIVAIGRYSILLGIVALVAGLGISIWLAHSISRPISRYATALYESHGLLAHVTDRITSASRSLAEAASEQASSLEETSSSLEEMSSMTKKNSENAQTAKTLANQSRQAADTGAADMEQMSKAMQGIQESSADISKIIKTIDEIAFQTNILALNAAVEAARAGEAGMGFAVVANEVRNLAQRSAQAARETADKIEGAIQKSKLGVEINSKVSTGLQGIVTKARQVDELIGDVAAASHEQSQGVAQVNIAVGQIDKVTQSNAANAEECAKSGEELKTQSDTIKEMVEGLNDLIGNNIKTQS